MIHDNRLIKNRPKILHEIEFYTELPKQSVEFNFSSLPEILNVDLLTLFGITPTTRHLVESIGQKEFYAQPTEKEIEYYEKRNTKFQIINVVANVHTFKRTNDENVLAYPYSISLIAGRKRGIPEICSIKQLSSLNLENISKVNRVYTDFSPFTEADCGFNADISFLAGMSSGHYSDTIGFILETFFLPTDIDLSDVPMVGPQDFDPELVEKYRKYRVKRYFKPFDNILPRKIWGCDSAIELFLIQGLARHNTFPLIQTLIFKDGRVFDNFFEMISDNIFIKGDEIITEADLYFPERKLAIFCDSTKHHRGQKNKEKDESIDKKLNNIGIDSLRIPGKLIVQDFDKALEMIYNKI